MVGSEIPPEEQLSLDEDERSARRRNAVRRKAAREEKESTDAQDQPDLEPAVEDAHQASPDTGAREGVNEAPPEDSERDLNSESQDASTPDAPAQASLRDASSLTHRLRMRLRNRLRRSKMW
ncbi:unnamed protein product [Phytophthora fragariaefolia]|uniref:Unnamed protein product n=1 Tax=Phytophthora fragariaefolia TaxID=1490495 RepID=A0A9W6Y428_9STRA|nr:unnamed protein product [Phytophthora fragariaefolia]